MAPVRVTAGATDRPAGTPVARESARPTAAQTSARPGARTPARPGARTSARPGAARATAVAAALALLAGALVALSLWAARPALLGDTEDALELDGGLLRVTRVTPEILVHSPSMPASMMPDPVPAGFRRISVDVTLLGRSGSGLHYDGAGLRLGGDGVVPTAAQRDGLGTGVVPEGSRLDGVLVFLVPEDATRLTLTAAGSDDALAVDLPPAPAGSTGHDEHAPGAPEGGVLPPGAAASPGGGVLPPGAAASPGGGVPPGAGASDAQATPAPPTQTGEPGGHSDDGPAH